MYRKVLIIFSWLLIVTSCTTQQKCLEKYPPQVREITKTVTVYRDTTIFVRIPGDTVHRIDTVWIDRHGFVQSDVSILYTRFAESRAWIKNSKLFHKLTQNEDTVSKVLQGAIRTEVQYVDRVSTVEVPRALTWWQTTQIWAGRLLLMCVAVLIGLVVARFVLKM